MLTSVKLTNKTYAELIEEAQNIIPVYSSEWTNMNPSDPGMTAVEIFSGLSVFQQQYMDQVSPEVKLRLLKLIGRSKGSYSPSETTLKLRTGGEKLRVLARTRFLSGGLCFENPQAVDKTDLNIKRLLFCKRGDEDNMRDLSYLIGNRTRMRVPIFGAKAEKDSCFCVVFDSRPAAGLPFTIDFRIANEGGRNPLAPEDKFSLADIVWQAYAGGTWADVEAMDGTHGFLQSGSVVLTLPDEDMDEIYGGYALRAVIRSQQYDLPPYAESVVGNTFPIEQTDTRVLLTIFASDGDDEEEFVLDSATPLYGYNLVFVKDDDYDDLYRLYSPADPDKDQRGRYYELWTDENLATHIKFDRMTYGHAPRYDEEAIRVVSYTPESFLTRSLGTVVGYDGEKIETGLKNVMSSRFELMVSDIGEDGEPCFYPARPGGRDETRVNFTLDEDTGALTMTGCCSDDENLLLVSSLTLCVGDIGRVRPGESMAIDRPVREYLPHEISVYNPRSAEGGRSGRTIEELRREFSAELRSPGRAVTESDYEELVRSIPGLLVHKVRAKSYSGEKGNLVRVAVKPRSEEDFPGLPVKYREAIRAALDGERLIATRVEVVEPEYVPIDVYGTVYVKPHFPDGRAMVEELMRRELDGITGDRPFGGRVSYGDIYAKIEKLPCVDYIYSLSLEPSNERCAKKNGFNIELEFNALAYMRRFGVEVSTRA